MQNKVWVQKRCLSSGPFTRGLNVPEHRRRESTLCPSPLHLLSCFESIDRRPHPALCFPSLGVVLARLLQPLERALSSATRYWTHLAHIVPLSCQGQAAAKSQYGFKSVVDSHTRRAQAASVFWIVSRSNRSHSAAIIPRVWVTWFYGWQAPGPFDRGALRTRQQLSLPYACLPAGRPSTILMYVPSRRKSA